MSKGRSLEGKQVSGDKLVQKLIAAEARAKEAQRLYRAVKADRDQLLDEFTDFRNARPVPKCPKAKPSGRASDFVRVEVSDIHGMAMDRPAVEAFLADVKDIDPDQVVILGDIIDCGGWLAKHQPIGFIALTNHTYQEDIQAANWFLDRLHEVAPRAELLFVEGNHDSRLERWAIDQTMAHKRDAEFLMQAFSPRTLLRMDERGIQFYALGEEHVPGLPKGWIKLGKLFYTHALGTSKNAARVAVDKTAGNVVFAHTHREDVATVRYPGVGLVKAFNSGCVCTLQPVWKNSDPSNWSHGYGIDFVSKSGEFLRVHIPIWEGKSLAGSMARKFKSA